MKVLLRQSGGGIPPFVYYEPFSYAGEVESSAAQAGGSSSDSESKLTDKDLFTMLKEMKGLPSDISEIMRTLSRVFAGDSLFANGSIDTSNLSNLYLKALHKMKIAEFNQKYYDEARKEVIDKGGLSEVAITDHGHIVVADEDGKITNVSVEELYENQDKYTPITNSDLFHIRAHNKSFDNTIIKMAQNGIGMSYVNEEIRKYLNDIGTNEVSQSGYSRTKNRQIQEGIEYLQTAVRNGADLNGMSMDGVYKSEILTKDQQSKAKMAINHIWEDGLDNPSKTLLKYKGGGEEGGKAILARYVLSSLDNTINFDVDAVKDPLDVANGSDGSEGGVKSNLYTNIVEGIGGPDVNVTLMDSNGRGMSIKGKSYPLLTDTKDSPIIQSSLINVLESGIQSIYRGGDYAITFGDKELTPEEMQNVVFTNDGKNARVILPIIINENGKIVPDLDFIEENKELIDAINSKGLNSPEVKELLKDSEYIDEFTGQINPAKFQMYLIMNTYAVGDFGDETPFKEHIKKPDDRLVSTLEKALNLGINKTTKHIRIDTNQWWHPGDWFGNYDDVYKGVVYIPISENQLQSQTGSGEKIKENSAYNLEKRYQTGEAARYAGNTGANVL